jgi:hypothetical protein
VGASQICVSGCDANPTACTSTQYCDRALASAGLCLEADSDPNALCASDTGCAAGLTCVSGMGQSKACKQTCSASPAGSAGPCPEGQVCLSTTTVENQPGGGFAGVACTPSNPIQCDDTALYECMPFTGATGTVTYKCARVQKFCGTAAAVQTSLTQTVLGNLPPEDTCGQASLSSGCPEPAAGTTAEITCATTGFANPVQVDGENVPCDDDTDCLIAGGGLLADAECANFSPPTGSVCAIFSRACVAFCEDDDGNELTCPAGLNCQVPKAPNLGIGGVIFGGNPDINCTNDVACGNYDCVQAPLVGGGTAGFCFDACQSDVDCETDFFCDDYFGTEPICIRTLKVCLEGGDTQLQCN